MCYQQGIRGANKGIPRGTTLAALVHIERANFVAGPTKNGPQFGRHRGGKVGLFEVKSETSKMKLIVSSDQNNIINQSNVIYPLELAMPMKNFGSLLSNALNSSTKLTKLD